MAVCCALLCIFNLILLVKSNKLENGMFSFKNFHENFYGQIFVKNGTVIVETILKELHACHIGCLDNIECLAVNFIQENPKQPRCQLLNDGKSDFANHLVAKHGSTYSRVKTQCFDKPCLNGGTCQPLYQDSNYTCTCTPEYTGRHCDVCIFSLGMDNKRRIADSQITASSVATSYWSPVYGRLYQLNIGNTAFGGWGPSTSQVGEYLQVDLLSVMKINKVATQGQPTKNINGQEPEPSMNNWVTRYGLSYASDGVTWTTYPHEFTGNSDRDTVVSHVLPVTIQARYIRFLPKNWHGQIALRAELFGCDTVCLTPLGMQSKGIANAQITASSFAPVFSAPIYGRLHQLNIPSVAYGAWIPSTSQVGEYLQVDLLSVMKINKVATQGQPTKNINGELTEPSMNNWVTRYGLSYASDGVTWATYPHVFTGNSDRDTVVSNVLPVTIQARYIRFLPQNWHGQIALRVELFGCFIHE
ncbi:lactadherin isoform X2 [Nematostella vectensis]|uniref:lactadherin isoform X2 n=1 Tax=Nematostella vectensis TaxID=45351 RepID=UPI0020778612|nr:lactadherin isoform X2 [Nematostella vectensis]